MAQPAPASPPDDGDDARKRERAQQGADKMRTRIETVLPADPTADTKLEPGSRRILLQMLLKLSYWRTLSDAPNQPRRALAEDVYDGIWLAVRGDLGPEGRLGVFPGLGVYLEEGRAPQQLWNITAIAFDASSARALASRLDAIGDAAMEWWPDEATGDDHGSLVTRLWKRPNARREKAIAERMPHMARAYDAVTSVMGAVDNENTRHRRDPSLALDDTNPRYHAELENVSRRADRAEAQLQWAARRTAQARYGRGMFFGTMLLLLLSAAVGTVFLAFDIPAAYGIAVAAGGMGAVVSVLQRMASEGLQMNLESTADLTVLGFVRPFIGVVFAFVVVGLLEADLLSIGAPGGEKVALYGVLAFFAGFNERFAQDALTSGVAPASSSRLTESTGQ